MKNVAYLFLFLCYLCYGMNICAQSESNSKQISRIQKDKHYIWAEGIDTTEIQAYNIANKELQNRINDYIIESGMAEAAKEIIVKNINQFKNEITMSRGGMHRVFLYVKQKDIVESSSTVKVITIEKEDDPQPIESPVQAEAKKQDGVNTSPVQSVPVTQKKMEVQNTTNIFSSMPPSKLEVVQQLATAKNLQDANTLLKKFNNNGSIKNYGVKKDCKDEMNSYWVVPTNDGVTVLSSQRNGQRWNYRTGKTDSMQNYNSGLWFRL